MANVCQLFQLDECLDWIIRHKFKRLVIQMKLEDLKHSSVISQYLKEQAHKRQSESHENPVQVLDLYITQSSTCCVDLLVTQHVSNLDAFIHLGNVCLSKPEIKNLTNPPPVFFAFGRLDLTEKELLHNSERILSVIESELKSNPGGKICLVYDTNLTDYAIQLDSMIAEKGLKERVDIADLYCPSQDWHTTPTHQSRFVKDQDHSFNFGHHLLKNSIDKYSCAIQLGDRRSIQNTLNGPSRCLKITFKDEMVVETVNISRMLNRRMALVSRLKDQEELKIGVLITNPLPDLTDIIKRLENYAQSRKHTLYFISMIQTIDECKIGNFDVCDAFIVINSCTCSTILESLVFNRPIITELEFKLACCFEAEYGRVLWPGASSHLSTDDMINMRKVSDVSLALVQTRNELLERCSQARANKWFGLEYKASVGSGEGCGESLEVVEGLKGIASSYSSEPLKRTMASSDESVVTGIDSTTNVNLYGADTTSTSTTSDVAGSEKCGGNK